MVICDDEIAEEQDSKQPQDGLHGALNILRDRIVQVPRLVD